MNNHPLIKIIALLLCLQSARADRENNCKATRDINILSKTTEVDISIPGAWEPLSKVAYLDNAQFHSSSKSLKITCSKAAKKSWLKAGWKHKRVNITGGKAYNLSFWYKGKTAPAQVRIQFIWSSADNSKTIRQDRTIKLSPGNAWRKSSIYVSAPQSTQKLLLFIRAKLNGEIWLDDFTLTEKPTGCIAGKLTDANKNGIKGSIIISGKGGRFQEVLETNENGTFSLTLPEGCYKFTVQVPGIENNGYHELNKEISIRNGEHKKEQLQLQKIILTRHLSPLHTKHGCFFNSKGQEITFYGVNCFGLQRPPFIKQRLYYDNTIRALANTWGFNAVRLPIAWIAIEPKQGVFPGSSEYNEIFRKSGCPDDYIQRLDWIINYFGSLGVYVIPELHNRPIKRKNHETPYTELTRTKFQGLKPWIDVRDMRKRAPSILGWLARHWQGNPNIAAIEIPYNEPSPMENEQWLWATDETYYDFIQLCARAVKQADPSRLVVMDPPFWAHDNTLPSTTWRTPPEVDGIFPHYYHGRAIRFHNYIPKTAQAVNGAGPGVFIAPYLSSGKPVMLGETGCQFFGEKTFFKDMQSARKTELESFMQSIDSIYSLWYAMGVKGIFYHTAEFWRSQDLASSVVDNNLRPTVLGKSMLKFSEAFKDADSSTAKVAIVKIACKATPINIQLRTIGIEKGLYPIVDHLLDLNVFPFHSLAFDEKGKIPLAILKKYKVLLIDTSGLHNLINNPGVENFGPDGKSLIAWHPTGQAIVDSEESHLGNRSLKLKAGSSWRCNKFRVTGGMKYLLSLYLKKSNSRDQVFIRTIWYNHDDKIIKWNKMLSKVAPLTNWQHQIFNIKAPASAVKVIMYICSSSSNHGAVLVDDLSWKMQSAQFVEKVKQAGVRSLEISHNTPVREIKAFLRSNGILTREKTPSNILLVCKSDRILAYERDGKQGNITIYPIYPLTNTYIVRDEQGKIVFKGTGLQLKEAGIKLYFNKWRARLLKIEQIASQSITAN